MTQTQKNVSLKERSIGVIIALVMACVVMVGGVHLQAASKHTTKPSVSVHSGNKNPFYHDTGKCTISYCTRHPKSLAGASNVGVTLEVKTNAPKSKKVFTTYNSTGVNREDFAFCDWNDGSVSITARTIEKDSYTAQARYITADFFCLSCLADDEIKDAEKYSDVTSSWKYEK